MYQFEPIKNKPQKQESRNPGLTRSSRWNVQPLTFDQPKQPSARVHIHNPDAISTAPISRFAFDFTRIPIHTQAPPNPLLSYQRAKLSAKIPGQTKLTDTPALAANEPDDEVDSPNSSFSTLASVSNITAANEAVDCPSGPIWAPGKHVGPDFILNKSVASARSDEPSLTYPLPPTFRGEAAVDCAANVWRYQLKSVKSKVIMTIVYWPKDHYPAPSPPDDTGPLKNMTKENWEVAVKDLEDHKDYITDFWSSYRAEDVHEEYHWTSWQEVVTKELPIVESEIEGIQVGFNQAPTAAKARKILKPEVKKVFNNLEVRAREDMKEIGDEIGDPPYKAQVPVIEALINRIKDYAVSNKWVE